MQIKQTERGWAGHLSVGERCAFTRNTLLSSTSKIHGDKKIVVSTTGIFKRSVELPVEKVSADSFYETMAFHAVLTQDIYWDADVTRIIELGPDTTTGINVLKNNSDALANLMHDTAVTRIKTMITNGGIK